MKCQKCGINEANVYIKQNINGVKSQMCLCSECANEENLMGFSNDFDNIFENMFSNMFSFEKSFDQMFMPKVSALLTASTKPNKTYKSFSQKHGLRKEIDNRKNISNDKSNNETIEELQNQLQEAIKTENYEKAAILRDKIKSMKQK